MSAPGAARASQADVAIIGMACLFPGAPNLQAYWENIVSKFDAIGDPPDEWGAEFFYDPDSAENDRTYTQRGGYLGDLARFDPLRYGVMPNSIDGGEPDQFLALHIAQEALTDAGCLTGAIDRQKVGVIIGRGTYINRGFTTVLQHGMVVDQVLRILHQLHPEHPDEELAALKQELKASLPPFNAEVAPGLVPNMMSGRIANRLDLMGANYTVDAACASSLVALDLAMGELASGRCDVVVAGGVHASTPAPILQIFCQLGALSKRGELRPFDADSDGTLLGEGLGFCVLKRRSDAERDGDRIYAVIKAIGTASDGRALGLLAPRVEGEELALRRAYEAAGVAPDTVELIEAHGTGTLAGDQAEIEALRRVFGGRGSGPPRCAVGSVKSMISHLIPAAGIAGVIKAALSLYQRVLPPTLHCDRPNPRLRLEDTPLYVNTETRPWIHGTEDPRRAGVNAFGFGGINAHAILEEHGTGGDHAMSFHRRWENEVFVIQGDSRQDLVGACRYLEGYVARAPEVESKDLAATLNARLSGSTCRVAIVASGLDELGEKLAHARRRLEDPSCTRIRERSGIYFTDEPLARRGKLAFLFPGEGSQYPGMLSDLCLHFPEVRSCFDLLDRAFAGHPRNYLPSQVVFPPPTGGDGPVDATAGGRLWQMDVAGEAIFAANQAMLSLLRRLEIRPDAVVGHSAGEYSALDAAGAHRAKDEEHLVRDIRGLNGMYEQSLASGEIAEATLLTVGGAKRELLLQLIGNLQGAVHLAMDNCPNQAVLCGSSQTMAGVAEELRAEGFICTLLPFARAYHTPAFEPFSSRLAGFFRELKIVAPTVELYSCSTAEPYPRDPDGIRQLAAGQWARPVRFRETVEAMYEAGVSIFVEVGARNTLTSFVRDILRTRHHLAIASNLPDRSGISQLNHLVAELAAHGVSMRLEHLYSRRDPKPVSMKEPAPPRVPQTIRLATGLQPLRLDRARRQPQPVPQAHATGIVPTGLAPPAPTSRGTNGHSPAPQGNVMDAYFSTMERFLATQDQVMGAYLRRGRAPSPPAEVNTPSLLPLLGTVTSLVHGIELVARRDLDPVHDLFLRDHSLGGRVSLADEDLLALPVVPLTMSMEAMAEAAAVLVPGSVVIGMREVRAHRWIALDGGDLTLELTARRSGAGSEVQVQVREVADEATGDSTARPPAIEATVILADRYPEAPEPGLRPLHASQPSSWTRERIYGDLLFHGPAFQGIVSVETQDDDGIEATLATLPADGLFRADPKPAFLTDPVLLDAAGQLVGCWTGERLDTAVHVFPFRVEAVHLFGPNLPSGQLVRCRARVELVGDWQTRSDIDLVGPEGRLAARLEGWWDRRFELPAGLLDLRSSPLEGRLCTQWPAAAVPPPFACSLLDTLSADLFQSHGHIWQRVLTHLVLSRRERDLWRDLKGTDRRRSEWLLGRATAKDAVRRFLQESHGLQVPPADIEVTVDEHGRPEVDGAWAEGLGQRPLLSLAHAGGVAVAIAGSDGHARGVGIDLEPLGPLPDGFAATAFGAEEQSLLWSLEDGMRDEWGLRLWCAKESVGKALGRGFAGNPRALVARRWNIVTGSVEVGLSEAKAAEFPNVGGAVIAAQTSRTETLIMATCVTERSL